MSTLYIFLVIYYINVEEASSINKLQYKELIMSEKQNKTFIPVGFCASKEELELMKNDPKTFETYRNFYEMKLKYQNERIMAKIKFDSEERERKYQLDLKRLEMEQKKQEHLQEMEKNEQEFRYQIETKESEFWSNLFDLGISCIANRFDVVPEQPIDPEVQKQIDVSNLDLGN